jgi:hypothetical protein
MNFNLRFRTMENKNRQEQTKTKNEQTQENPSNETSSKTDTYKRTVIGTGAQKSDENFDNTRRQTNEKDIEDRDTNDGDANTENNF